MARKMNLILILLITLTSKMTLGDEKSSSEEGRSASGQMSSSSFERKSGLADVPDQLAIESSRHESVVAPKHMPAPFAMKAFPGSLILPMPPGFKHQPKVYGGQPQGPQGQYSQQQPIHKLPPKNFQPPPPQNKPVEFKLQKAPAVLQQHLVLPQHQHQYRVQQQQPQFLPPQMVKIPQQARQPPPQNLQQAPPKHQQLFLQPDLKPPPPAPQQQPSYQNQQPQKDQIANNLLRELLERQKLNQQSSNQQHFNSLNSITAHHQSNPVPSQPGQSYRPQHANKEIIASTNDLQAEGGEFAPPINEYGAPVAPGPIGSNAVSPGLWPETADPDMPKIAALEVKCEKNLMRVYIAFDKPFFGLIFSKGHYHNKHCIHLPAGLGHTSASFDITIDGCGTSGNMEAGLTSYGPPSGAGTFFENIIVIQYDSQVQEVWDQARKLRCTWHDQYEKSVTFRPFPVDMLDVVRADFAGDNVGCWMQIQVGKGPWASEVSGLVKIGQTMTMVLAIKDDENKFDMLVRNCMAHDGAKAPIQLVDQFGCISRPKLMSRFTKIKNFGASASVLSYAHFQAFKFPDSMEVHFQCTIQICRHQCPEQCQPPEGLAPGYGIGKREGLPADDAEKNTRRRRRSPGGLNDTVEIYPEDDIVEFSTTFSLPSEDVGMNKVITVVSPDDLEFLQKKEEPAAEEVPLIEASFGDVVCMSTFGFASMLVLLIGLFLVACLVSTFIILRRPRHHKY